MSNFREGIKNRTMDSFLVVIQKLLSCSSRFSQSTKQGNPCQIFAGLKAQILKNVPAGIWESFARLRFSFPVAGFFGGPLRPDSGAQVPENSLKQFRKPKPRIPFPVAGFFGGRLRPDKGTRAPENSLKQVRKPKPQILISCGWIFWWPVAAR